MGGGALVVMTTRLLVTAEAKSVLDDLAAKKQYQAKLKKVRKTLGLIQQNPRYPGLNSHKYVSLSGDQGEDVWESYVENQTPGAWRVFWHYGPSENEITILTIGPHP
ncbi:hypothetical protein ABIB53_002853 [Janibacter sp. UYMM211]